MNIFICVQSSIKDSKCHVLTKYLNYCSIFLRNLLEHLSISDKVITTAISILGALYEHLVGTLQSDSCAALFSF